MANVDKFPVKFARVNALKYTVGNCRPIKAVVKNGAVTADKDVKQDTLANSKNNLVSDHQLMYAAVFPPPPCC